MFLPYVCYVHSRTCMSSPYQVYHVYLHFLYIFVYIYAQFYTLYKDIYMHRNRIYQSSNGLTECKS